jgi:allantoin racemase
MSDARTRIWYQSMAPIRHMANYTAAMQNHAKQVCSPGVEVTVNGASDVIHGGRRPPEILSYPLAKQVVQSEAIKFAVQAERDGYDAMVIGSFSEPFLVEIRSLLEIPVVSLAESSLMIACSLAEQFALVSVAPPNTRRLRTVVARHGMEKRVMGLYSLPDATDEWRLEEAFTDPGRVVDGFIQVAKQAVQDGADVVIPAEGLLNEILFQNGVKTVDRATILDSIGASFLYAEMMLAVKSRLGNGVGRRWTYIRPPAELLDQLMELLS